MFVVIAFITIFVMVWLAIIAGSAFIAPFLTNFFPGQEIQTILVIINILFFIGIPLVMVVIGVSRIAFRTRMGRGWKTGMGLLWLVNAISLFAIGGTLAQNFAVEGEMTENIATEIFVADTVQVGFYKLDEIEEKNFHFGSNSISLPSTRVYVSVKKSENDLWSVEQTISSRGSSLDDAESLARSLQIPLQMKEGQLLVPKEIPFTNVDKWRAQEVVLTIYMPEGAVITFDETFPYRSKGVFHNGPRKFWDNPTSFYKMEKDGVVCLDCPAEKVESTKEPFENKAIEVERFSSLSMSGAMKISIVQGDEFEVRVSAEEQYQDQVNIENNGDGLLTVQTDLDEKKSPIRIYITMPELTAAVFENTDDVLIKDFDMEHLQIQTSGDFELKADVKTRHLEVALSDQNEFEFIGGADLLTAVLTDRARMDTDRGFVAEANLELTDNSRIKMSSDVKIANQSIEEGSELRMVD